MFSSRFPLIENVCSDTQLLQMGVLLVRRLVLICVDVFFHVASFSVLRMTCSTGATVLLTRWRNMQFQDVSEKRPAQDSGKSGIYSQGVRKVVDTVEPAHWRHHVRALELSLLRAPRLQVPVDALEEASILSEFGLEVLGCGLDLLALGVLLLRKVFHHGFVVLEETIKEIWTALPPQLCVTKLFTR